MPDQSSQEYKICISIIYIIYPGVYILQNKMVIGDKGSGGEMKNEDAGGNEKRDR